MELLKKQPNLCRVKVCNPNLPTLCLYLNLNVLGLTENVSITMVSLPIFLIQ